MSINPNSIYRFFNCETIHEINRAFEYQWRIQGPLSGDLVAGLLIGLQLMFTQIILANTTDQDYPDIGYFVVIKHSPGEYLDYFDQDNDIQVQSRGDIQDDDAVLNYIIYINYEADRIIYEMENRRDPYFEPGKYGWWISTTRLDREYYDLVTFTSAEFIQGFISMCSAFGVDFRRFVFGSPFMYDRQSNEPIFYAIEGYPIDPILRI